MTSEIARWSRSDGIAVLTFDNPPVNAISQAVRRALVSAVDTVDADADIAALVIICAGRTFFAGADIKELGKPPTEPFLSDVVDTIGACSKPVVAAIHGNALGGGLEIAMACHHRVTSADAKLGLPEVTLGLMPGARGTQLLPRLAGVERALEIIAFGRPVSAYKALEIGLIDHLATGDLLEAAVATARSVVDQPIRRTSELPTEKVDQGVFDDFANAYARKFRGLDAPNAIISSVRNAAELPFAEGARQERELFLKLREGPQQEALRHVFFATREASKLSNVEEAEVRKIDKAGVVGSGTMGSGIAIALLSAGIAVTLFERDAAALERGTTHVRKTIEKSLAANRISAEAASRALAGLQPTQDIEALAEADLIIEAVHEDMAVKQEIFGALDKVARPGAILASNTSYLDLDAIAAVTDRPADVIGLHFFSPANVMKLLEVVRGAQTSPDVIATAFALAKRIGKVAVLSRNAWGFIGNRMLAVRRHQAEAMAAEGAAPAQIDKVLEDFGMAMGPFRVGDLAGLDLGWTADASSGATIRERLCEAGRRGQKTGAGFYDYAEGKALPSPEAMEIIAGFARDQGITQRDFNDEEILDRLLWPMVNEGAQLLFEGVAQSESDIDVVWLNGYGWPAWTGGPMFHARRTGYGEVIRRLNTLGITPTEGLKVLAAQAAA